MTHWRELQVSELAIDFGPIHSCHTVATAHLWNHEVHPRHSVSRHQVLIFLPNIQLGFAIRNVLHALGGEDLLHKGFTQLDLIQYGSGTWDRNVILGANA